jgi:hypothetical protein
MCHRREQMKNIREFIALSTMLHLIDNFSKAREERASKRGPSRKGECEKAADSHSAMQGRRLNGSDTLKHCGVISLRALCGLHLKNNVSTYIFIGCESQEASCRKFAGM